MGLLSLKPLTTIAAALMVLALSACQGPRSLPTSYYMLHPEPVGAEATQRDISIGVGPVRIASFLDRLQIVSHHQPGELDLSDRRRWAEPLNKGIQRVLTQNLVALTGADIRSFPWTRTTVPAYAVRIEVLDLNRSRNGDAILEAGWLLEDLAGKALTHSQRDIFREPVDGDDTGALVRAYSKLLGQLALRIADQLPTADD